MKLSRYLRQMGEMTLTMASSSRPLTYAKLHRCHFVTRLQEFVHFPSVSAQPQHA